MPDLPYNPTDLPWIDDPIVSVAFKPIDPGQLHAAYEMAVADAAKLLRLRERKIPAFLLEPLSDGLSRCERVLWNMHENLRITLEMADEILAEHQQYLTRQYLQEALLRRMLGS